CSVQILRKCPRLYVPVSRLFEVLCRDQPVSFSYQSAPSARNHRPSDRCERMSAVVLCMQITKKRLRLLGILRRDLQLNRTNELIESRAKAANREQILDAFAFRKVLNIRVLEERLGDGKQALIAGLEYRDRAGRCVVPSHGSVRSLRQPVRTSVLR